VAIAQFVELGHRKRQGIALFQGLRGVPPPPGQEVLRREVAGGTVQADGAWRFSNC
jgi:hypothetical protein